MKKIMLTLVALLTMAASARAMSYEQARNEALFLTDKMAYELNLTDAQYEAAYEINLDYLMGVTSQYDVFGPYWERRNLDLSYILFSWQWDAFCAASYFYRPLYWNAGYWHFGVYARYPHRDHFFFGRPGFYISYRGGHSWRMNGGRSFYEGRRDFYRPGHIDRDHHFGMRNGWDRGDFRNNHGGGSSTNHGFRGNNRDNRDNHGGFRGSDMGHNRGGNSGGMGNHDRDNRDGGMGNHGGNDNGGMNSRGGGLYNGGNRGTISNGNGNFGGSRSRLEGRDTRSVAPSNMRNTAPSTMRSTLPSSNRNTAPSMRSTSPSSRNSMPSSVRSSSSQRMHSSTPSVGRSSTPAVRSSSSGTRSSGSMGSSHSGGSRSGGSHIGGGHSSGHSSGGSHGGGHFGGSRR